MSVTAKLSYLNIAPRKVRLVADLVRGKTVEDAQTILKFTVKQASQPLLKLLKSAVANARNNFQLEESNLYISKILVDEGSRYKRFMPRARGQAYEIQKKTSHVVFFLDETVEKRKKIKKIKKIEKIEETEKKEETIKTDEKLEQKTEGEMPKKERPELKPELKTKKPRIGKGLKRIFRRKSF